MLPSSFKERFNRVALVYWKSRGRSDTTGYYDSSSIRADSCLFALRKVAVRQVLTLTEKKPSSAVKFAGLGEKATDVRPAAHEGGVSAPGEVVR